MEKIIIIGKLTKAEINTSQNGKAYAQLNIEHSKYKQDGNLQVLTSYATTFNEYAIGEMSKHHISLGDYVYGEGYVDVDTYQDKQGQTKVSKKVILSSLILVDKANKATNQQVAYNQPTQPQQQYNQPINPTQGFQYSTTNNQNFNPNSSNNTPIIP